MKKEDIEIPIGDETRPMLYTQRSLTKLMKNDSSKYDTIKNVRFEYIVDGSQATYLCNDKTMYRRFEREKGSIY